MDRSNNERIKYSPIDKGEFIDRRNTKENGATPTRYSVKRKPKRGRMFGFVAVLVTFVLAGKGAVNIGQELIDKLSCTKISHENFDDRHTYGEEIEHLLGINLEPSIEEKVNSLEIMGDLIQEYKDSENVNKEETFTKIHEEYDNYKKSYLGVLKEKGVEPALETLRQKATQEGLEEYEYNTIEQQISGLQEWKYGNIEITRNNEGDTLWKYTADGYSKPYVLFASGDYADATQKFIEVQSKMRNSDFDTQKEQDDFVNKISNSLDKILEISTQDYTVNGNKLVGIEKGKQK